MTEILAIKHKQHVTYFENEKSYAITLCTVLMAHITLVPNVMV